MTSTKNVKNTHIAAQLRQLHEALLDIVALMNQPQRDEVLIKAAGISLDRALFPLLVGIAGRGPIGVVDLAGRVGRDYTTVSRQVARLESLGLVARRDSATDRRVREAVITEKGGEMIGRIDAARLRLVGAAFSDWEPDEIAQLSRLMRKFADAMANATADGSGHG